MYFQQGQIDEAYIKFSQVQENSVFYAKANYFRGIIEIKRKEYDKAKTTFDMIQKLPEVAVEFGESQKVKEMSKIATGQLYYARPVTMRATKTKTRFSTRRFNITTR